MQDFEQRVNGLCQRMAEQRDTLEEVHAATCNEHSLLMTSISHWLLVRSLTSVECCPATVPVLLPATTLHLTNTMETDESREFDANVARELIELAPIMEDIMSCKTPTDDEQPRKSMTDDDHSKASSSTASKLLKRFAGRRQTDDISAQHRQSGCVSEVESTTQPDLQLRDEVHTSLYTGGRKVSLPDPTLIRISACGPELGSREDLHANRNKTSGNLFSKAFGKNGHQSPSQVSKAAGTSPGRHTLESKDSPSRTPEDRKSGWSVVPPASQIINAASSSEESRKRMFGMRRTKKHRADDNAVSPCSSETNTAGDAPSPAVPASTAVHNSARRWLFGGARQQKRGNSQTSNQDQSGIVPSTDVSTSCLSPTELASPGVATVTSDPMLRNRLAPTEIKSSGSFSARDCVQNDYGVDPSRRRHFSMDLGNLTGRTKNAYSNMVDSITAGKQAAVRKRGSMSKSSTSDVLAPDTSGAEESRSGSPRRRSNSRASADMKSELKRKPFSELIEGPHNVKAITGTLSCQVTPTSSKESTNGISQSPSRRFSLPTTQETITVDWKDSAKEKGQIGTVGCVVGSLCGSCKRNFKKRTGSENDDASHVGKSKAVHITITASRSLSVGLEDGEAMELHRTDSVSDCKQVKVRDKIRSFQEIATKSMEPHKEEKQQPPPDFRLKRARTFNDDWWQSKARKEGSASLTRSGTTNATSPKKLKHLLSQGTNGGSTSGAHFPSHRPSTTTS